MKDVNPSKYPPIASESSSADGMVCCLPVAVGVGAGDGVDAGCCGVDEGEFGLCERHD
jgi:hypothetical protein